MSRYSRRDDAHTRERLLRPHQIALVLGSTVETRCERATREIESGTTDRGYPFEVLVTGDESDFNEDSSIRLDQIRSVDIPDRIQFVAGQLSASTMREVDSALKLELDLD